MSTILERDSYNDYATTILLEQYCLTTRIQEDFPEDIQGEFPDTTQEEFPDTTQEEFPENIQEFPDNTQEVNPEDSQENVPFIPSYICYTLSIVLKFVLCYGVVVSLF